MAHRYEVPSASLSSSATLTSLPVWKLRFVSPIKVVASVNVNAAISSTLRISHPPRIRASDVRAEVGNFSNRTRYHPLVAGQLAHRNAAPSTFARGRGGLSTQYAIL